MRSSSALLVSLGLSAVMVSMGCGRTDAENARRDGARPRGARLVSIPGATFSFREDAATTRTQVTVRPFQIEATEVTVSAYAACVTEKACNAPADANPMCNWGKAGRGDNPINCVLPSEAEAYCKWNSGRRLPTIYEAYWAALGDKGMSEAERLGDQHRMYPWGRDAPEKVEHCWKRGETGGGVIGPREPVAFGTCPVASYTGDRSPFGVYDMAGNVSEIVWDPKPTKGFRVTGGAWSDQAAVGDPSPANNHPMASGREPKYGFRCVAEAG